MNFFWLSFQTFVLEISRFNSGLIHKMKFRKLFGNEIVKNFPKNQKKCLKSVSKLSKYAWFYRKWVQKSKMLITKQEFFRLSEPKSELFWLSLSVFAKINSTIIHKSRKNWTKRFLDKNLKKVCNEKFWFQKKARKTCEFTMNFFRRSSKIPKFRTHFQKFTDKVFNFWFSRFSDFPNFTILHKKI